MEIIEGRSGLISRSQAEERATKMLASSDPEVSGVKIDAIRASCLTTLGSYERDVLKGRQKSNPDVIPPDTMNWMVEVAGRSTPEGILSGGTPFNFAMAIIIAKSGEYLGRSHYQTPLLSADNDRRKRWLLPMLPGYYGAVNKKVNPRTGATPWPKCSS